MNIRNQQTVETLNDLIAVNCDAEAGYKEAASGVDDVEWSRRFQDLAAERSGFIRELSNQVVELGGEADKDGHVSAKLHRGWMNVKKALSSNNLEAVVEECERGESVAEETYDQALQQTMPAHIQSMVKRQHDTVRARRNTMRVLEEVVG